MKREFVINRQGKEFVLYAGLLDLATERGLQSIATEAISATATSALFKATATFSDGRTFSGHGDATPENVGKNIAPHFVRMAETRAKARALRDALNIGAAALEELGGDDEAPVPPPLRPNGARPPAPQRATPPPRSDSPASPSAAADRMQALIDDLDEEPAGGAPEPVTEETRLAWGALIDEIEAANPKVKVKLPPDAAGDLVWREELAAKRAAWQTSPHNPRAASASAR